ncbi:MAG: hypothetical protein ACE5HX_15775, partial [bacterium]
MSEGSPLTPKGGIGKKLRVYFFTGLLVLVPLVLTGYIIWNLFLAIDGILRGFAYNFILEQFGVEIGTKRVPGIGF